MAETCEVVITASDPEWLGGFTRALVEDRLAACGQLIDPVRSIFWWEGEVQEETEARVALHTRTDLVREIVARADTRHPYDVPCVIAFEVRDGNPDYLAWVLAETEGRGR